MIEGFGHAEVDDLGNRFLIVFGDEDVRRLDVAVNDPFLMRVLDRLADGDEQLQSLARREVVVVAVPRDRHALDQLHDEIGVAGIGGSAIQDPGDVGVIHDGQGLSFGFEPGDHLPGIHPGLDQLQRHTAFDRFGLLGHIDHAHAPFADFLQQFVRADLRAGFFQGNVVEGGRRNLGYRLFQEAASSKVIEHELVHFLPEAWIILAGAIEKGFSFLRSRDLDGVSKNRFGLRLLGHGRSPFHISLYINA